MTLSEIREARAAKVAEMRKLLNTADTEKRSLNDGEKTAFDKLKAEIESLEADEARAQYIAEVERRAQGEPVSGDKSFDRLQADVSVLDVIRAQVEGRSVQGAAREYTQEVERRTGRRAQGAFIPMSALEKRVSTTTSAEEIVPTQHRADMFIQPFRNSLLARRLGVRVLTGLTGNLSIPKYGTGLTTGWVAENSALTPSDMTFDDPVTLQPRHAGGLTELSRQLLQQSSPDIEDLVRGDLSYMLAQAIDSALIKGGGSNEPVGILSSIGSNGGVQQGALSTLSWAAVLEMIEQAELENASVTSWLTSPQVKTKLASTLKSATSGSSFLMEGGRMADRPVYTTNQVPLKSGSPDAGIMILGDWSQVMLGIWSEIDILVNPFSETAYTKGNVLVRAMSTVDIGIRHPESFIVADDITI